MVFGYRTFGCRFVPKLSDFRNLASRTEGKYAVPMTETFKYDAWGNLRNPTTWSGSYTGVPRFDRGFTGHEHHRHFGLINMNGRMYDPVMSCFLSVDSYVQDPENPQNFNRYAYCLNNPLKYTDPDGEWVHVAVGALFGGVINLSANWNNCEGFWQYDAAFGAGAVNGALSVAAPGWGSLLGGAVTGATNNLISQTGKNFSSSGSFNFDSFLTSVFSGAASGFGGYLGSSVGSLSIGAMKITSPALKSIVGGVVGGACGGARWCCRRNGFEFRHHQSVRCGFKWCFIRCCHWWYIRSYQRHY